MKRTTNKTSQSTLILLVMLISVIFIVLQTRWAENNRERLFNQELIDQLQQANPTETLRAQCGHCNSRGQFSVTVDGQPTEVPCPVCKGLGFSRIMIQKQTQSICPLCHGLQFIGNTDPLSADECPQCLGAGVVDMQDPYSGLTGPVNTWNVECHHCNVTGQVHDPVTGKTKPCPVCLGLTRHEIRQFYPNDGLCPACGGMGRNVDSSSGMYEGPCERCGGRGVIRSGQTSKD